MPKRKLTRREMIAGTIGLACVGAVGYRAKAETNELRIERVALPFAGNDGRSARFAFLTDWHLDNADAVSRASRSIETAANLRPDAILLGGDYCSWSRPHWRDLVIEKAFKSLADTGIPVYAVLGNHDYASRAVQMLPELCQRLGIRLLVNEAADFRGIRLVGTDDMLLGRPDLAGTIRPDDPNQLLLMHEPDFVPSVLQHVGASLSGHTHGGQICLAPGKPVHLPKGGRRFVAGKYEVNGRTLYVSRGIGMTGLDFRLFSPPEVTLLTLT